MPHGPKDDRFNGARVHLRERSRIRATGSADHSHRRRRRRSDVDPAARPHAENRHERPARAHRRERHGDPRPPRAGAHQRTRYRDQVGADRQPGALRVQGTARRTLQRERLEVGLRHDAVRAEPPLRARASHRARRRAGPREDRCRAAPRRRPRGPRDRRSRRSRRRGRRHRHAHAVPERQAAARAVGTQRVDERSRSVPALRPASRRVLRVGHAPEHGVDGD